MHLNAAILKKMFFSPALWPLKVRTQWGDAGNGVQECWSVGERKRQRRVPRKYVEIIAGMFPTQNLRVSEVVRLSPPRALKAELPMTEAANATVVRGRQCIQAMLEQKDPRLLVVVGPCSIHDAKGAMEYAGKLNALR